MAALRQQRPFNNFLFFPYQSTGIVVADGRRDLVDGRSRKLQQFPSASHSKELNGRLKFGWCPSE
jgi:hypothetical protein